MSAARRIQSPVLAALLAILLVAGGLVIGLPEPDVVVLEAMPRAPVSLPRPGHDADGDGYSDGQDVAVGDLYVAVSFEVVPSGFLIMGTQDDQWRHGAGRELAWRHVVDVAPSLDLGSNAWRQANLRTGAWISIGNTLEHDVYVLNVRDDASHVLMEVESWRNQKTQSARTIFSVPTNQTTVEWADNGFRGTAWTFPGPSAQNVTAWAQKWAPTLHFDSGELFYPTSGTTMMGLDGYYQNDPVLEPWSPDFNNGRDGYRLLKGDYDGSRDVDYLDVALRMDGVRALDGSLPTVYSNVIVTHDMQVVIQYWFLYVYNFVLDDRGREVTTLAHDGDREYIQLTFRDAQEAANGSMEAVSFSQHYHGIRVLGLSAPPEVWVARGAHASYPAAGDDGRVRQALAGFGDRFDGTGITWTPEDYSLETFGTQKFHLDTLWGPVTRFHRDLGTSARPLLKHDFRYPFYDPLWWESDLPTIHILEAEALYGGGS